MNVARAKTKGKLQVHSEAFRALSDFLRWVSRTALVCFCLFVSQSVSQSLPLSTFVSTDISIYRLIHLSIYLSFYPLSIYP